MKLNSNIQFVLPNTAMGWEVATPPTPMRRAITAYSDGTTNTIVACATHGLATGDLFTISGTTSYNGTHVITKTGAGTFTIPVTYASDDGASIGQKVGVLTLGRADVKVILYTSLMCYYRFSATQPSEADGQLVATTDLFISNTTEKELYVPHGLVDHEDDNIYLLLLADATGAPVISAVVQ